MIAGLCGTCRHAEARPEPEGALTLICARVRDTDTTAQPKCQSRTLYVAETFGCVQWRPKESPNA